MKRILVVDDDEQIRDLLSHMLELEAFLVDTAEDGEVGMNMLTGTSYDLIIIDMIMPVKDGLKLIMELVRDLPEQRILAISGGGAIKAERYLTMAGYIGNDIAILEKPFTREALLVLVNEQLAQS